MLIGAAFHSFYPSDKGADLGVTTWPNDAWRTGEERCGDGSLTTLT